MKKTHPLKGKKKSRATVEKMVETRRLKREGKFQLPDGIVIKDAIVHLRSARKFLPDGESPLKTLVNLALFTLERKI